MRKGLDSMSRWVYPSAVRRSPATPRSAERITRYTKSIPGIQPRPVHGVCTHRNLRGDKPRGSE
jgi:hypothetical protein